MRYEKLQLYKRATKDKILKKPTSEIISPAAQHNQKPYLYYICDGKSK